MSYRVRLLILGIVAASNLSCKSLSNSASDISAAGSPARVAEFPFAVALTFATRKDANGRTELVSRPETTCAVERDEDGSSNPRTSFRWDEAKCSRQVFCSGALYVRADGSGPVRLVTGAHCIEPRLGPEHLRLSFGSQAEQFLVAHPYDLVGHPKDRPEPVAERFRFDIAKANLSTQILPDNLKPLRLPDAATTLPAATDLPEKALIDIMLWHESGDITKAGRNPKNSIAMLAELMPIVELAAFGASNENMPEQERDEGIFRSLKVMTLTPEGLTKSTDLRLLPTSVNEGICSGDSGGPIVLRDPQSNATKDTIFRLIGVVSSGLKSACRGTRASAANVLQHLDWLSDSTPRDK